jgi:hypothetical protein
VADFGSLLIERSQGFGRWIMTERDNDWLYVDPTSVIATVVGEIPRVKLRVKVSADPDLVSPASQTIDLWCSTLS